MYVQYVCMCMYEIIYIGYLFPPLEYIDAQVHREECGGDRV